MIFSRVLSVNLAIENLPPVSDLDPLVTDSSVQSYRNSRRLHMLLGLANRIGSKMKDRSGQDRTRMAIPNAFHQMIKIADPA